MSVYGYRRGSIFWALILIAVGVIFLWQNFDPNFHAWQMIAKFWPILIIFWGISKLIDYVQAQRHPETAPVSLFSGSEVLLLVLILVLGTMISKAVLHPWRPLGWRMGGDEIYNMFLNSYTYTRTLSQPVPGAPHLMIDDQRGDLEIHGSDQATIDVAAKETIRAEDENAAKKISDNLILDFVPEGGHYVLRSNRRTLADDGRRITMDLTLRVPSSTSSQDSLDRGAVTVDNLRGDQTLSTQKGDVRATNIQGIVKVQKSGGSTEVRGVKGSVEIDGRGDDLEVADVSDTVTVHGEFGGALAFRNIGQTLRYESARTDMTAQKVSGDVNMEMGSMEVKGVDGPLEITTRQKDVSVTDFKHTLHISDTDGRITLQTSTPPSHDISVEAKNGDVELTLPSNSSFEIAAASRHGEVECDFSGPGLKVVNDGGTPSVSGSYGKGGPMIRINTEYGAIRILRAGSQTSPASPAPHTTARSRATSQNVRLTYRD